MRRERRSSYAPKLRSDLPLYAQRFFRFVHQGTVESGDPDSPEQLPHGVRIPDLRRPRHLQRMLELAHVGEPGSIRDSRGEP